MHHAIAFAIASEFCRKHPFARNFRSKNENLPFHPQNRSHWLANSFATPTFGDRKGTTKKLCDKDFAERSGELSGAICLKTLVLLGNAR